MFFVALSFFLFFSFCHARPLLSIGLILRVQDTTYQRYYEIVVDVLYNWNIEKNGGENPSRCLPQGYLWFSGSGGHNWFRNKYSGGTIWNYSLPDHYSVWDV